MFHNKKIVADVSSGVQRKSSSGFKKPFYKRSRYAYWAIFMLLFTVIGAVLLWAETDGKKNMVDNLTEKEAVFAGGCFWCMEPPYDKLEGVKRTVSGYIGGLPDTATYEKVSSGATKHREAIKVVYDPSMVSYEKLLEIYWENVDPLDGDGQFCDKGYQYTAAIFYNDENERKLAQASALLAAKKIAKSEQGKAFATKIEPASPFYDGESYHQDYAVLNPYRYKTYRFFCGRDKRLSALWPNRKK